MENKNNSITPSKNDSDSNPFPKLKPMGSIYINQIPKKDDTDKISKNINSLDSKEESNFLSKLRIFDPHANIHHDTHKHSKSFLPSFFEKKESNKEKGNIDDVKEKDNEVEDKINNNNENIKLTEKKLSEEINSEEKGDENGSGKNPFDAAKKIFHSISGYLNENFINKNNNKNENEKEKEENLQKNIIDNNLEQSSNFQEIEKHWNYQKLLLNNNILDFTSKL